VKNRIFKFVGLIVLFVLPMTIMAQNRGQGRPDFQERMKQQREELKKTLDLKKDQAEKFDKIYNDFDKKRQEMMESMRSGGGDREGMREKMTKMNTERDEAVKKILDKEQVKKYEAYLKKQEEDRAARANQRRDGGGR